MIETRKPQAYQMGADDKKTLVMVYTHNALIRGEAVTKESIRVSIWLRTQGAPEHIHLLNANILIFGGAGSIKQLTFSELFVPLEEVLAFHLAPPGQDPIDYDETEENRVMEPVTALVGTFRFKGHLRLSEQTDVNTHLSVSRSAWFSLYNLEISNPYLTGMGTLKTPMTLVRPTKVMFGLQTEPAGIEGETAAENEQTEPPEEPSNDM